MRLQKYALLVFVLIAAGILAGQQVTQDKGPQPTDMAPPERGERFQVPDIAPPAIRQQEPLQVESFAVHELAEGTQSGARGDLVVAFSGRGFMLTAKSPTLVLAKGEVVLDRTEVDLAGTRLYVIVPREMVRRIARLDFREVVVRNPGALEDTEYSSVVVPMRTAQLIRPAAGAPKARLMFREGEFMLELVNR